MKVVVDIVTTVYNDIELEAAKSEVLAAVHSAGTSDAEVVSIAATITFPVKCHRVGALVAMLEMAGAMQRH
jgi:hypothetical protein